MWSHKWLGMGKDICETFKIAKETYEEADEVLGKHFSRMSFDGPMSELTLTENAQPGTIIGHVRVELNLIGWIAILCHSVSLLKVLKVRFFFWNQWKTRETHWNESQEHFGFDVSMFAYALGHSLGE